MTPIQEIFEKIIVNSDYFKNAFREGEEDIDRVMETFMGERTDLEKEAVRDSLYGISYSAEKAGFEAGFQYAVRLMLS